MGMPGTTEIIIIAIVAIVIFGPKKIPEFAKGLGDSIAVFRKSAKEVDDAKSELREG